MFWGTVNKSEHYWNFPHPHPSQTLHLSPTSYTHWPVVHSPSLPAALFKSFVMYHPLFCMTCHMERKEPQWWCPSWEGMIWLYSLHHYILLTWMILFVHWIRTTNALKSWCKHNMSKSAYMLLSLLPWSNIGGNDAHRRTDGTWFQPIASSCTTPSASPSIASLRCQHSQIDGGVYANHEFWWQDSATFNMLDHHHTR